MEKKSIREIISVIFKAVTLAMGIAVVVLSRMGSVDVQTSVTLLGIGLACGGAAMPAKQESLKYSRNPQAQQTVRLMNMGQKGVSMKFIGIGKTFSMILHKFKKNTPEPTMVPGCCISRCARP